MNRIIPAMLLLVVLISACHGDYWSLGDGYVFVNRAIARQTGKGRYKPMETLVMDQVLNFAFDDNFIIVYQIPDRNWLNYAKDFMPAEKIDSIEALYVKMEDIHHCYWIIRKADAFIIGPMNKDEFEVTWKEMNINLKLDPKSQSKYI